MLSENQWLTLLAASTGSVGKLYCNWSKIKSQIGFTAGKHVPMLKGLHCVLGNEILQAMTDFYERPHKGMIHQNFVCKYFGASEI